MSNLTGSDLHALKWRKTESGKLVLSSLDFSLLLLKHSISYY
jgi:hypothetical protein